MHQKDEVTVRHVKEQDDFETEDAEVGQEQFALFQELQRVRPILGGVSGSGG